MSGLSRRKRSVGEEMLDWRIGGDGGLWYQGRVCVPNNVDLSKEVMVEVHHSSLVIHPGSTKMYNDVKRQYWWNNIKRDITGFVAKRMRKHDSILVIVDRLTKAARFLPIHTIDSTDSLEEISTEFKFSMAFHPQILEDMLRACVLDFQGNWDNHLALVEFAYNNSFQSSIGMALYEALYGSPCRAPQCWVKIRERNCVGAVAYRLALPTALADIHNVFHISMLKKYTPNDSHIVSWDQVELAEDASYTEDPICILDRKEQVLWTKTISLVKVLWSHHGEEKATCEREAEVMEKYPHMFSDTP
ncbi:uncharacterized protein LOC131247253 [Magnolia sinica]|uniref:uncharacterized protein LOC131247253 n=1 Tax=Magnolia sinica TaxID=86752 RepID=UPI0026580DFA|nr:uncharacterized protein LOC131247253 [Magnolia sinica]